MKNSADLRWCYPPWLSASVDNTLLDLQNSSHPTQPHSIIAKYTISSEVIILLIIIINNKLLFCSFRWVKKQPHPARIKSSNKKCHLPLKELKNPQYSLWKPLRF